MILEGKIVIRIVFIDKQGTLSRVKIVVWFSRAIRDIARQSGSGGTNLFGLLSSVICASDPTLYYHTTTSTVANCLDECNVVWHPGTHNVNKSERFRFATHLSCILRRIPISSWRFFSETRVEGSHAALKPLLPQSWQSGKCYLRCLGQDAIVSFQFVLSLLPQWILWFWFFFFFQGGVGEIVARLQRQLIILKCFVAIK